MVFFAYLFPTSLCGVLVFGSALPPASFPPPAACHTHLVHTQLLHTQFVHTQLVPTHLVHTQLVTTQLVHTQLVTTQLVTTQLVHTQLVTTQLVTTQLVTTHLVHTQLVTTQLVHTQLVTTQLTHNLHTHTQLAHTQLVTTQLAHAQLADHTQLVTTQLTHTQLAHKQLARTQLALTHTHPHTHRQTHTHTTYSQLAHTHTHTTFSLCVAGVALMALGWLWWRSWFPFGAVDAAAVCAAGVALRDFDRHFAWQAWHLWHWAGSGGALGSRLAPWTPPLFAWQAWHFATSTVTLRGRRGTWRHRSSLCVAGVALMALGWLWWRAWFPFGAVGPAAVCAAGVALGDIDCHFAWQAWHLATSIVTLRGRRSTYGTGLARVARLVPVWRRGRRVVCVAGVALGDIDRHFAWQAWHLATSTVTLRGRRGTWRHRPPLCVAGVALMALDWLWWHTKLFHTTLSQIHFTHNFVRHNPFTHNFVTHTQLFHTQLFHTTLSHTSLSHTNFYTQHFYIHKLTHTHNTVTHSSFTQPVSHHLLSFLPFPSHFHTCLVIIGRRWFVGLSGPLI